MSSSNLKTWLKSSGKKTLRRFGIEAHGYIPGASREAQLMATLRHAGIRQVFDIGANTGQFGRELIDAGYDGQIISVEPLVEAHATLQEAARPFPAWVVHPPVAVGASEGETVFHVAENSVSSSAFEVLGASVDAAPASRQVEKRVVPLTTVDRLAAQYGVQSGKALLKVDTQGYEGPVLDGAQRSLARFELVLLELSVTPLYAGQMLWLDAIERMKRAGFAVWALSPEFIDPRTGQTLQLNGLFHRLPTSAGES
jgi:FkbM family methyltransferase